MHIPCLLLAVWTLHVLRASKKPMLPYMTAIPALLHFMHSLPASALTSATANHRSAMLPGCVFCNIPIGNKPKPSARSVGGRGRAEGCCLPPLLQGHGGRAIPGNPYLAKQIPQRSGTSLHTFTTRASAGRADGGKCLWQTQVHAQPQHRAGNCKLHALAYDWSTNLRFKAAFVWVS